MDVDGHVWTDSRSTFMAYVYMAMNEIDTRIDIL